MPGDFFPKGSTNESPQNYLSTLQSKGKEFVPVPTSQHGLPMSAVPSDLKSCQYVFIRVDSHKSPLSHPYEGPFKVINSGSKVFTVDRGGKLETVSIDRLKAAHLDFDAPIHLHVPRPRGRPKKTSQRIQ